MTARIALDTGKQGMRLAFGLVVILGLAGLFAYAAVATADSVAKQVGAWALCGVFLVFGGFVAIGGAMAMRPQAIVVTAEGIARDAARQPWRVSWSELDAVAVEESWRFAGRRDFGFPKAVQPKVWRVVLRLAPTDPAAFAARHDLPSAYRGRFGASADEWGVWLGPVREVVQPLDEALRTYGGGVYRGAADLGEAKDLIFAPTGTTRSLRHTSS